MFARLAVILALCAAALLAQQHQRKKPAPAEFEPGPAPTAYTIEMLTVEGNHVYTAEQILAVTGLRVGDKGGRREFDAAREKLAATGSFDNVAYRYAPSQDAEGYDVSFEVSEIGQLYPMRFDDLPASDAQLRAWLKQKDPLYGPKIPATQLVVDRYVKWIAEYLAAHHAPEAVTGRLTAQDSPELTVVFRPAQPLANIAHVVFTNTGDVPVAKLETAIYGVAIGVPYTERHFRLLLDDQIRPIFEAHGLLRVSFPKIETAPAKDVTGVSVTVQVESGPVYKLTGIRFAGSDLGRSELRDLAKLKVGQTVNFDEVKAAQARIRDALRRRGRLDAASQVQRNIQDSDHTIDITIQIDPGTLYTFGQLNIVGLDVVSEPEVRKMWGLTSGRPFNVDYPDVFLAAVKSRGIFDNLKSTRSETKRKPDHAVDVTLYFNR